MITEIRPQSFQKYLDLSIFGPVIDEFCAWVIQRAYTQSSLKNKLNHVCWIDRFLAQQGTCALFEVNDALLESAWQFYRYDHPNVAGTVRSIEQFLEQTGRLAHSVPKTKTPATLEMDRFSEYLRNVCGFQGFTIQSYIRYLREFLEHLCFDGETHTIATITVVNIEDFINFLARRLSRYSLQHVVGYLRTFLRFHYDRGVLPRPLHTMIDTPRIYKLEQVPRSLSWETVRSLLLSIDTSTKMGIRDYSILFLIACYGLRCCEVVSLKLDDINWREALIRIPQGKTKNQLILPITDEAGNVLIEYLKSRNPEVPFRELFFRVRAPIGPLLPASVQDIFESRVRLSGLDIPHKGPHCLRHSFAVHLLRQATPVKTIGDLLGHRSAESTQVYLRLNIEDLRSAALSVPEEVVVSEINTENCRAKPRCRKRQSAPESRDTPSLTSFISGDIDRYLQLKLSLGRQFAWVTRTLHSLNTFLASRYPQSVDLSPEMFSQWCITFSHLSPTTRRQQMLQVRNFCFYLRRSNPHAFVPDLLEFPKRAQHIAPYIFSELDVARLINATRFLPGISRSSLRSETFRIAIILLFTTGLRKAEVVGLKLRDLDQVEKTLLIESTKFHKSRLIPLSFSVFEEIVTFLGLRRQCSLPMEMESPLLWNGYYEPGGRGYCGRTIGSTISFLRGSLGILARNGKTPRVHDFRHSYAVTALQRWYQSGDDVHAKLPILATYMGHASIESTYYYLTFIQSIRNEADARFYLNFGKHITDGNYGGGI